MSKIRADISVSIDGYVAGPNQSVEDPLGEGGERLHDWIVALRAWREPHGREGGEVNASSVQAGRGRRRPRLRVTRVLQLEAEEGVDSHLGVAGSAGVHQL